MRLLTLHNTKWVQIARDAALIKQGGRCLYCDSRLTRKNATADHYRAIAKHGHNEKDNIVAACLECNQAKGSLHGDAFRRLLKKDAPTNWHRIKLRASVRRLELESQRAQKRILALVGLQFERAA